MPRYRLYGAVMDSEIDLPGVSRADGQEPRWRARRRAALPPMQDARELGDERIYGECHARLFAHRDGWRIVVDDTGAFDLLADGEILVAPKDGAWEDFVRAHLTGRVLATAMYRDGLLPLHASAVATREGVIAFLAPKGFGKSSLAAALVQAGAALVSDDTLPIVPSAPPMAWPGVHVPRVHQDVQTVLGVEADPEASRDGKRLLALPESAQRMETPQPLAALFLIAPFVVEGELQDGVQPVARAPLNATMAAAAVVAHVKCGEMLGRDAAGPMLARTASIVRLTAVSQLAIHRDLARLPEIARTILGWYGGPPR